MSIERRIIELERYHGEAGDVRMMSDSQLVFIATNRRTRDPEQVSDRELERIARMHEDHNARVDE